MTCRVKYYCSCLQRTRPPHSSSGQTFTPPPSLDFIQNTTEAPPVVTRKIKKSVVVSGSDSFLRFSQLRLLRDKISTGSRLTLFAAPGHRLLILLNTAPPCETGLCPFPFPSFPRHINLMAISDVVTRRRRQPSTGTHQSAQYTKPLPRSP